MSFNSEFDCNWVKNQHKNIGQSGKLTTNLDQNGTKAAESHHCLAYRSSVEEILITVAHVIFYVFYIELLPLLMKFYCFNRRERNIEVQRDEDGRNKER